MLKYKIISVVSSDTNIRLFPLFYSLLCVCGTSTSAIMNKWVNQCLFLTQEIMTTKYEMSKMEWGWESAAAEANLRSCTCIWPSPERVTDSDGWQLLGKLKESCWRGGLILADLDAVLPETAQTSSICIKRWRSMFINFCDDKPVKIVSEYSNGWKHS